MTDESAAAQVISASNKVEPKILKEQADKIGKDAAVKLGFALESAILTSRLIWTKPMEIQKFG